MNRFFVCSYMMVSGNQSVNNLEIDHILGMHMVKYGCDLLGPETLKTALSQE